MKHKFLALISAICLVGFISGVAKAATTGFVPVSAVVESTSTLTIEARNVVGNGVAAGINFGLLQSETTDAWSLAAKVAEQYVYVNYNDNNKWQIEIYTDNFAGYVGDVSTNAWAFNYGGMIGTMKLAVPAPKVVGNKIYLAWQVEDANTGVAPVKGSPSIPATGWISVYDKHNQNDPSPDLPQDDSWGAIEADGGANIAYGTGTFENFVDPANEELDPFTGLPKHSQPITNKDFAVYLECLPFANADTYSTNLNFDLLHK